jgi:predicted phosphodiesterase
LLFYGQHHPFSDKQGASRYVNPGSLGCYTKAVARYSMVVFTNGRYTLTHHAVAYDEAPLRQAFAEREVPERGFLWQAFFGGRCVV